MRPQTGEVAVFPEWPQPGQSISTTVRWVVEAASGAQTETHSDCDLLRVQTPTGSTLLDPKVAP